MLLIGESFECPGYQTSVKQRNELEFCPQKGISHLAKKKGFGEGYGFPQIATMDLFKSWNSAGCPRNLYYKASSKKKKSQP